jgi:hypothetical protein
MSPALKKVNFLDLEDCEGALRDIKSVYCDTQGETSTGGCYLIEDTETVYYDFDLKKVDGAWKIYKFYKVD